MTQQTTNNQNQPTCDWCGRPVTDDAMTDARGWAVHETCFNAARDEANAPEDFETCPCGNPDC